MAWDNDRPYAPFWNNQGYRTDVFGSMDNYGDGTDITFPDIDTIYDKGEYVPHRMDGHGNLTPSHYAYRPFKEVELELSLVRYEPRRANGTFWWADDDGRQFPMFAREFNRLLNLGLFERTIEGRWSAQKLGLDYGIRLVETL